MPYGNWETGFQEVYDATPGTRFLEAHEERHVQALFEAGFTHSSDEYESLGLDADSVQAIRREFADYMGLDITSQGHIRDFPWDEWREAMGYDE